MASEQPDVNPTPEPSGQSGINGWCIEYQSVPIEEAIDTGKPPEMLPDDVFQRLLEECGLTEPSAESSSSDHTSPS